MDEARLRAGLTSIRSTSPLPDAAHEEVLDAAAALQVRRGEIAAHLASGDELQAEVVAVGLSTVNEWIFNNLAQSREVLSARPNATAAQLRHSLPVNRLRLGEGVKMVSLFDYWGLDHESRVLLANETVGTYLFGIAPVQMKIVDQSYALLQGPAIGGSMSVMKVWAPSCLEAAWRYWQTALAYTIPLDTPPTDAAALTPRQRQVVALLAADLGDDAIATALGVSVRTVRADVAAVLKAMGVRSRFAAGMRLKIWDALQED